MLDKTCLICERRPIAAFRLCRYHKIASERIREAYTVWQTGYGDFSWRNYLKKVISLPETGQWALDVAKLELSDINGTEESGR